MTSTPATPATQQEPPMSASIPTPKFSIGQKVWRGSGAWSEKQQSCPDCLGQLRWSVTTPAGETFNASCATCERGYECTGTINSWDYHPRVDCLTIGSVRIDSADAEHPVSYMCHETGIGSGQIHYEPTLAETEGEAAEIAEREALDNRVRAKAEAERRAAHGKRRGVRKPARAAA